MQGLYELWLSTNNAEETHRLEDPTIIKDRVLCLAEEWKSIQEGTVGTIAQLVVAHWSKPAESWTKANAYGALLKAHDFGGGGASYGVNMVLSRRDRVSPPLRTQRWPS